jgi:predicted nucleic acid-binding protein
VIVVDASVLAPALGDDGADGDQARDRLKGEILAAPELIDLEVSSVFRRLVLSGSLPARRAELALSDLVALPLRRVAHRTLLSRNWGLRDKMTVYDAAYVALAEELDVTLVTSDLRLSLAPGLRCPVEVLVPRHPLEEPAP